MKVLGIPTKIEPSFWVLSLFLASSRISSPPLLFEWAVIVFISVMFHELGHALVGRRFGLSPQIKLYSMGGLTSWSEPKEISPLKRLAISLAGPAAGFLLGGICYIAGPPLLNSGRSELFTVAYHDLIWINIGWGFFNLLPMLPLDGGNVVLTLESWLTKKHDQIFSRAISLLTSLSIIYLAFMRRSSWVAILGIWFAYSNASYLLQRLKRSRDQKLQSKLTEAREEIDAGNLDAALKISTEVKKKALTDWVRSEASRLIIFIFIKQDRYKEAEEELIRFNGLFGPDHYLQGMLSFKKKEMAQAIPDLQKVFDETSDSQVGLMLGLALMAERRYADVLDLSMLSAMSSVALPLLIDLQIAAFHNNAFEISVQAGGLAYEQQQDPNTAYNVACAFARASDATQSLVWLERALASGFSDKNLLNTDPDLQAIRSDPRFDQLLERYGEIGGQNS